MAMFAIYININKHRQHVRSKVYWGQGVSIFQTFPYKNTIDSLHHPSSNDKILIN